MSDLKIKGVLKTFLPVESGTAKNSGNEWKKQSFVISNNDGYEGREQVFCFEVFGQEKVDNLSKYQKVGDEVEVSFNISVNEWKEKYYTTLQSWKIEKVNNDQETPRTPSEQPTEDDLPF